MSTQTVTLFFALLAVTAQVVVLVCLGLSLSPRWRAELINLFGPLGLAGSTAIAVFALGGSLYLSEGAHFVPCKLCWYQRIAMYPIAVILVAATVRRETAVRPYIKMLATIGAVISCYHILIERFPNLESSACDPTNPCSLKWVEKFGYVTIPVMALTAFVSIFVLLSVHRSHERLATSVSSGE